MWRRVATAVGILGVLAATVVVRIPALTSARHIDFDEGVYGVSVLAMRSGAAPFRDVFSSQGPLFLPILWAFDTVGLHHFRAARVGMVLTALIFTVGVYVIARRVSGSAFASILAAAVVGTASAGVSAGGAIHSDGPALAFGVWALAVVLGVGPFRRWRPVVVGVLVGAGMAVKSVFLVPVALAVVWHYGRRRKWRELAEAAGSAAVLGFLVTLPWGLGNVWDQFVLFQLEIPRTRNPYRNLVASVGRMWRRDSVFLAAAAAAILGALIRLARRRWPPGPRDEHLVVLVWLVATAAVLLLGVELDRGSYRFLVFFMAPAMVFFAIFRPPLVLVVVTALAAAGLLFRHYHENDTYLERQRLTQTQREVVAMLDTLPEGALVISDDPGVVWAAGRRPPAWLVDPSWARIRSGYLTTDEVVAGASRDDTCAVLFYTDRFDFMDRNLTDRLSGYELAMDWGNHRRLWLKEECLA